MHLVCSLARHLLAHLQTYLTRQALRNSSLPYAASSYAFDEVSTVQPASHR